jgi:hypothetical protein
LIIFVDEMISKSQTFNLDSGKHIKTSDSYTHKENKIESDSKCSEDSVSLYLQ